MFADMTDLQFRYFMLWMIFLAWFIFGRSSASKIGGAVVCAAILVCDLLRKHWGL